MQAWYVRVCCCELARDAGEPPPPDTTDMASKLVRREGFRLRAAAAVPSQSRALGCRDPQGPKGLRRGCRSGETEESAVLRLWEVCLWLFAVFKFSGVEDGSSRRESPRESGEAQLYFSPRALNSAQGLGRVETLWRWMVLLVQFLTDGIAPLPPFAARHSNTMGPSTCDLSVPWVTGAVFGIGQSAWRLHIQASNRSLEL